MRSGWRERPRRRCRCGSVGGAVFGSEFGQGDSAGAENVVEVTLGNVMCGRDLGRAEMRVVQMCAGVLQDPQRQCRFQCILAEFGGVEAGGDDGAHEFDARFAQHLRAGHGEQVGTRCEPAEVCGSYVCHRMTRAQRSRPRPAESRRGAAPTRPAVSGRNAHRCRPETSARRAAWNRR